LSFPDEIKYRKMNMEILIASLTSHGHRVTTQRVHIMKHLWQKNIISNIDDLYVEVRTKQLVSWATVYSTIKLLCQLGWLQLHGSEAGDKYYSWIKK
jgi:Fe2+ or Zn2+ uptake regulation protein